MTTPASSTASLAAPPEGDGANAVVSLAAPPAAVTAADAKAALDAGEGDGLSDEQHTALDAQVTNFLADINVGTLEPHSDAFNAKSTTIRTLGSKEIEASASAANRLVQRPLQQLNKTSEGKNVASGLTDLRNKVQALDPTSQRGFGGLLAKLPFGSKLQGRIEHFLRDYQTADKQIQEIVEHLRNGQEELMLDNVAIDDERKRLWLLMGQLKQFIYLATQMQTGLEAKATEMAAGDPELAKQLREDFLFNIVQKRQDLLTQRAVSMQGYMAFGLIKKNNEELIKGVDRACTTTVSALRTAVAVASALQQQKAVGESIDAVNATTDAMIKGIGTQLREQTDSVYRQASSSGVSVETLKGAFADIFATMDSIDAYQSEAIKSMTTTAEALQVEVNKAQDYVKRSAREDAAAGAAEQLKI